MRGGTWSYLDEHLTPQKGAEALEILTAKERRLAFQQSITNLIGSAVAH